MNSKQLSIPRYALGGAIMAKKCAKPVVAGRDKGGPLPRNAPTTTPTKASKNPHGGGPMSKSSPRHTVSPYGER